MLNLLFIQLIIVFIIDISGAIDSAKYGISKVLTRGKIAKTDYRIKPFDCSLCSMFWIGIVYLLITHSLTIPLITYVCLLSATTSLVKDLYFTIYDLIIKLLRYIDERTN